MAITHIMINGNPKPTYTHRSTNIYLLRLASLDHRPVAPLKLEVGETPFPSLFSLTEQIKQGKHVPIRALQHELVEPSSVRHAQHVVELVQVQNLIADRAEWNVEMVIGF